MSKISSRALINYMVTYTSGDVHMFESAGSLFSEHSDRVSVSTRTFTMFATNMLLFGTVVGHTPDDVSEPMRENVQMV